MPVRMPDRHELPDGPLRVLIQAVHDLYNTAGRPGVRRISEAIKVRDDLRDTVSHETVSAILHGSGLPGWTKLECVVRQLATWAVSGLDPDAEVLRFNKLWITADDASRPTDPGKNDLPLTTVDTAALADMPRSPASPAPVPVIKRPVVSGALISNAPARNSAFIGRTRLLAEMRRLMDVPPRKPLVIRGVGGVGKTELTSEFAHDRADRYDIVWWVPASDPAHARSALAALAERLDLPRSRDLNQIIRATLDALESTHLRWLLVFHNADDPNALAPMLPAGGDVIVTTRTRGWSTVGTVLEIDVFDRHESVELLCRDGSGISPDQADLLAAELGDLPLALEHVAAVRKAIGMPVTEYLRRFTQHRDDLLGTPRPEHPVTVVAFVRLALQALRDRAPAACALFELFAFLGSEPVPVSLLRLDSKTKLPPSLGRALHSVERVAGQLASYGLARLEPRSEKIQVHGLIRSVLREQLGADRADEVRTVTHRVLGAINPGKPDDPRTWSIHADLGPHLVASEAVRSGDVSVRRAFVDQIRYLERRGEYAESCRLGELAVSTWDRPAHSGDLGPEDELTFTAIRLTANAMRALGQYDEAREKTEAALKRLRDSPAYGDDHPSTLHLAGTVGVHLRITGAYAEALWTDRDVVARHTHRDGEDSEPTLRALGNLAVSLRMNGQFAEAHMVDLRVRHGLTRLLGADHPRTVLATANLARDLYGLGRYREGHELIEGALPIRPHGSSHDHLLQSNRMRVIGLRRSGRRVEALELAEAYLRTANGLFEDSHPNMLLSMLTLTNTLWACGRVTRERAVRMHAGFRRAFDGSNPVCLAAAANYAAILRTLGDRREAYDIARVTVEELEDAVGEKHPYTLAASNGLANSIRLDHEPESALALSRVLVDRAREALGADHPYTVVFEANLGRDLASVNDPGADALRDRAVKRLQAGWYVANDDWLECDLEPPEF